MWPLRDSLNNIGKSTSGLTLLCLILLAPLKLSAESLKATPEKDLFTLAQFAYQKAVNTKKPEQAKEEFQYAEKKLFQFVQKFPRSASSMEAYYFLANTQLKLEKEKEALTAYVQVLRRTNEGPIAGASALQVGSAQLGAKDYVGSLEYLSLAEKNLSGTASGARASYMKAIALQKLEQWEKADLTLNEVLANEKGKSFHSRAHFKKGEYALQCEDLPAAYQHFQACTSDPDLKIRAQAVHKSALLAQKLGDEKAALGYFSRVLKTPSLNEHHPSSALILMLNAEGKKDWKTILKQEKYGAEGLTENQAEKRLLLLARAYESTGNKKKAQALFTEIASTAEGSKTGFEVSYQQLAGTKIENLPLEQIEKFLKIYTAEFSADPRYESVRLIHAEKLNAEERYEEAVAAYKRINLDQIAEENHPIIAFRIAKGLLNGKTPTESFPYIDQFQSSFPDDARAPYLLYEKGHVEIAQNTIDKALTSFTQVIQHKKSDKALLKNAWISLAELHLKQERYPEAIAAYESLCLKYASGSEKAEQSLWNFWLGYAQFQLQKNKEAQRNFLNARKLNKKSKPVEIAQFLSLIAFKERQTDTLKAEVAMYEALSSDPLPTPLYLYLAIEDAKKKSWPSSWKNFQKCVSPSSFSSGEHSVTVLETYAQAALETRHFPELKAVTSHLKTETLEPYRKATNLYRSGLSLYELEGAKKAEKDVEDALLINPAGRLKNELLLLHGMIEMDLGRTGNGTRVLKRIIEFPGKDEKELQISALKFLIKKTKENPSPESLNQLKSYQSKLDSLQ